MQRQSYLFMVSYFTSMSWPLRERERWVDRVMRMIHHVVVLCDPQLFIVRCSIKQAWRQLLLRTMQTAHDPLCDLPYKLMFIRAQTRRTQSVLLRCTACILSLTSTSFVSLPLVHIYSFLAPPPLPLDSISPDNEAMIHLSLAHCSAQSASVFLSDCECVCVYRLARATSNAAEAGTLVHIALCSLWDWKKIT